MTKKQTAAQSRRDHVENHFEHVVDDTTSRANDLDARLCTSCGAAVPLVKGRGRARRWCSETCGARARKKSQRARDNVDLSRRPIRAFVAATTPAAEAKALGLTTTRNRRGEGGDVMKLGGAHLLWLGETTRRLVDPRPNAEEALLAREREALRRACVEHRHTCDACLAESDGWLDCPVFGALYRACKQ